MRNFSVPYRYVVSICRSMKYVCYFLLHTKRAFWVSTDSKTHGWNIMITELITLPLHPEASIYGYYTSSLSKKNSQSHLHKPPYPNASHIDEDFFQLSPNPYLANSPVPEIHEPLPALPIANRAGSVSASRHAQEPTHRAGADRVG